jgi:hypothetical protein
MHAHLLIGILLVGGVILLRIGRFLIFWHWNAAKLLKIKFNSRLDGDGGNGASKWDFDF